MVLELGNLLMGLPLPSASSFSQSHKKWHLSWAQSEVALKFYVQITLTHIEFIVRSLVVISYCFLCGGDQVIDILIIIMIQFCENSSLSPTSPTSFPKE